MGLDLCIPHQCQCGSPVDARGLHGFVCRRAPGRSARHHALNDLVARCFASAGTPVTKEPTGLFRKKARWSNTRPMAERQVFMLGRDGGSGRIIRHWVRPRGRCCSGTRRFLQRGKICQHWKRIPLCAHRGRNLRPNEHVGTPTLPIWEERSPRRQAMTEKELLLFQRVSVLVQR